MEEPQEGTSVMYRNIRNKRGNLTLSTPVSITRDLASCELKRRRLVSAGVLHSCSVSPISRSPSPASPDYRPFSPESTSSSRPVSPDRTVTSTLTSRGSWNDGSNKR